LSVKRSNGISGSTTIRRGSLSPKATSNEFLWHGYDLRKRPHNDRYNYGFLPPRFFNLVLNAFIDWYRAGRGRVVPRE
jgi:hypothetical protein